MTKRSFSAAPAMKSKVTIKLYIEGPGGAGKTLSSLLLAYGLCGNWSKIFCLDTENGSANYYASKPKELTGTDNQFMVVPIEPPFEPEAFVEAIKFAEGQGAQVIVIDTISQEWGGKGGVLEKVDQLKSAGTNSRNEVSPWNTMTPRHQAFLDAIIFSPCHVICTVRSKQEVAMQPDEKGKVRVVKIGLQPQQRDGFDYEFGLGLSVDMSHMVTVTKDRTGLFMGSEPFVVDISHGQLIRQWCESGNLSPDVIVKELLDADDIIDLDTIARERADYLEIPKVKSAYDQAKASFEEREAARKEAAAREAAAKKAAAAKLIELNKFIGKHEKNIDKSDLEKITEIFKEGKGLMLEFYKDGAWLEPHVETFYNKLLKRKTELVAEASAS